MTQFFEKLIYLFELRRIKGYLESHHVAPLVAPAARNAVYSASLFVASLLLGSCMLCFLYK